MTIWMGAAAALVILALIALLLWLTPAKTVIDIDTGNAAAKADLKLLWGLGPAATYRALRPKNAGRVAQLFHDAPRIGYALITPGLVETGVHAVRRVMDLGPRLGSASLAINLNDTAHDLVVQTALKAALAGAPAAYRERIVLLKHPALGASITAKFELDASPAQLWSIYSDLKNSRSAREFRRRLKRKIKTPKKAPKAVTTS